ncbi:Fe-S cluster assembly protein SufD [Rhodopila sp.]|uniref:Fe-S cluster assembly protein SufD n=1 Tax=Rhodopila sp. TaxID=2480087 RepID=UPI002D09A0CF|nr:Fe-S cluster assembly protein SufD [Rhodopila sp.]HVZ10793.1 Fe-S cluster assembly protein SufD [Rhodopila sp.]
MSFLDRYGTLVGKLPGDSALRAAAADAFRAVGLPGARSGRRSEAWKYTSLRPVAETKFRTAAPRHPAEPILAGLPRLDAPRLLFVDGTLSDMSQAEPHVDVACFSDQPDFGTLTWPDREPLVALNTMLAEDGASLHVPANQDGGTIQLVHIATTDADLHPRHSIRLDPGAMLTLVEISAGAGPYLLNTVMEIHVADGAHLTHVRLQDESLAAFHVSTTYADIGTDATYDSFTLNIGARLSRTEVHANLAGERATAHLNAAQLLAGTQHADFTSVVGHLAPNGTSRQTVKNVLSGRSRGVFQGRIEVARAAQKTDGYQMNQALLLSPDAEVDSKPELEIFADDVKCSHGATVGELDAEQLFYLRSRGVAEADARAILVRAFLSEALDAITNETIRDRLETVVDDWWRRHPAT